MMQVCKALATGFGIGYIRKGGGTWAAAFCGLIWFFVFRNGYGVAAPVATALILLVVGIWTATVVERDWGVDSSRVVIDEMAGMAISVLFLPVTIPYLVAGFVLFRFFDIAKPLFIRRLEDLPAGWGVMMDDVAAGIYSNLILQGVFYLKWF